MTLTTSEQKLLSAIRENPFASQQEYADKIELSRSATANLISKLISEGYIIGKPYLLSDEDRVLCIGGANIDRKLFFDHDPVLGTSNPVRETTSFGGVSRNIAENLGRLGINTGLMTLCGKDLEGDGLIKDASVYVDTSAVKQLNSHKTSAYFATLLQSGELYMGLAAMSICELMDAQWIHDNQRYILSSSYIVCDLNVDESAVNALKMLCQSRALPLAIIGVSAPKMTRLSRDLAGITLGIFNRDESQAYFNTTEEDVSILAKMWLDQGLPKVIVTAGTGNFAFGDFDQIKLSSPTVVAHPVDVTGAGDAFSSGVIYGLIRRESFESAIKYGINNATLTVQTNDSVRKDLNDQMLLNMESERTKN